MTMWCGVHTCWGEEVMNCLGCEETRKRDEIFKKFATNMIENMKDPDPEFSKTIDDHFWELI